jgi:hypothetical protein
MIGISGWHSPEPAKYFGEDKTMTKQSTINGKRMNLAQIALLAILSLTATTTLSAQGNFLYAVTTASLSTDSATPVPIPGLTFTLPAASSSYSSALVTLNLPDLYGSTSGSGWPAGEAYIAANGSIVATGQVSTDSFPGSDSGTRTLTVTVKVPLTSSTQTVEAEWNAVNSYGSQINLNTFASLSAILEGNLVYAEADGAQSTNSQTAAPIAGLSFDLPAKTADYDTAIVTLDLPNLYLSNGGEHAVWNGEASILAGTATVASGQIGEECRLNICGSGPGSGEGRKPLTLVVKIKLLATAQTVQAQWHGLADTTINTDTFASLSAILTKEDGLVYVQTRSAQSTGSQTPVSMTDLSFDLPAASADYNAALVTLDLPNLYLTYGTTSYTWAGSVDLLLSGVTTIAQGWISADVRLSSHDHPGSKPLTIVVRIGLLDGPQSVQAQWFGARSSGLSEKTFASLSAVLVKD